MCIRDRCVLVPALAPVYVRVPVRACAEGPKPGGNPRPRAVRAGHQRRRDQITSDFKLEL
eukprot:14523534-Alexandrium_andersonii.AAC.1